MDDIRQIPSGHLYVISGCSGSGKSTLITELAQRGEVVVPEPGRRVVQAQDKAGGPPLPWGDLQLFVDRCTQLALHDYDRHVGNEGRVFFDRSLVDLAAAVEIWSLAWPSGLEGAIAERPYSPLVFMSPPWEKLFRPDTERRHTYAEAVKEYENLVPAYRRSGYEIRMLPQAAVADRADFVLSTVIAHSAGQP